MGNSGFRIATAANEVKQAANSLHDKIIESILDIAKDNRDNMKDLDAANGVFNRDTFGTDGAVDFLLFRVQLFTTRFLGGLLNSGTFGSIALEAGVLKQS